MIQSVNGIIKEVDAQHIIVEVGPVCLNIAVANGYDFLVGNTYVINTYLHWNADTGPQLFGFKLPLERTIFLLIISCSGIGPKLALSSLKDLGPAAIVEAVSSGNERMLAQVSGIGIKKAEQLIVHLKHKVTKLIESGVNLGASGSTVAWHELGQALESLNYSKAEIAHAISHIQQGEKSDNAPIASFDQLLRKALVYLSKQS